MPPIHGGSDALSVTMTTRGWLPPWKRSLVWMLSRFSICGMSSLTYTPGRYSQLSELLRLDISVLPVPWRIKIRSRCWARPQISQDGLTVAARSTM